MKNSANLVKRFVERMNKGDHPKWGVRFIDSYQDGCPKLIISHPAGLVSLFGYLKRLSSDGTSKVAVYCRGECKQHDTLIPSIFRSAESEKDINNLRDAEEYLEKEVKNKLGSRIGRFRERHISAILQHYGIRTSWIDLVDNLFIAVWFALNERISSDGNRYRYSPSSYETGWIHFIQDKVEGLPALRIRDLRSEHLPLSLRPHAQHGLSATRWSRDHWDYDNIDLSSYLVVAVQIPNKSNFWHLSGYMFQQEFLFPNSKNDHTYRILLRKEMSSILNKLEKKFGLSRKALGRVDKYY